MSAAPGPFWTVVTGTAVFVLGQIILKIIIDPYLELQKIIGRVAYSIIHYANVYSDMPRSEMSDQQKARLDEAILEYRGLASQLVSVQNLICGYGIWRYCFSAPSKTDINEACKSLIALSNSLYVLSGAKDKRHEHQQEIKTRLGIITIKYH